MGKRKNITREEILEAASRKITTSGAETSLGDIAAELGVSKGTLFYHYPSKSDLVFDVTTRHFDQVTAQLVAQINQGDNHPSPEVLIHQVLKTLLAETTRNKLHHYLLQEATTTNPRLLDKFRDKYQEWHRMIVEGFESTQLGSQQNEVTASVLLATIDGLILQNLIGMDDYPMQEIAGFFVRR